MDLTYLNNKECKLDEVLLIIENITNHKYFDYSIRLISSLLCSLFLGIERKQHQEIVGIRTLMLISISSCLLSILSLEMAKMQLTSDCTRIAAGVVTGIGFIGAGAIIKQGINIKGLTTASIVFCASAMGLCCGSKLYFPSFAVLVLGLFILSFFHKIEQKFFPLTKIKHIKIIINSLEVNSSTINEIILNNGIIIKDTHVEKDIKKEKTKITYSVKCSESTDTIKLSNMFTKLNQINKIIIYE